MVTDAIIGDRREKELELLQNSGFMAMTEISQAIGVSASTVRRDLGILEDHGFVRRTHGGALCLRRAGQGLGSAATGHMAVEKQAIARAVAELIAPGQTLMLNGGTTCLAVAHALQGRHLNVVTNSVAVATLLSNNLATEVTVIGGYVYPRIGVALGPTAQQQLASLHAGQFVTSCAGLTAGGAFEPNQLMADVERQMMGSADEVILAVDHGKLNMRSVVKLAACDELDVIVTDAGADEASREWLARLGVRVVIAPLDRDK